MSVEYLKKAAKTAATDDQKVGKTVADMLAAIEAGGEDKAVAYAREFDRWDGDIVASADALASAADRVPQRLKDDIRFAHDRVRGFAEAQLKSGSAGDMYGFNGFTIDGEKARRFDNPNFAGGS